MANYRLAFHGDSGVTLSFKPDWQTKDGRSWPQLGAATFSLRNWHVDRDIALSISFNASIVSDMSMECLRLMAYAQEAVHAHMEFVFRVVDVNRHLKRIEG